MRDSQLLKPVKSLLLLLLYHSDDFVQLTQWCIAAVDEGQSAAEASEVTAAAAAAGCDHSDKDETASVDDDDEYGFDPKLHVWQPPVNPVVTEERPDGIYYW